MTVVAERVKLAMALSLPMQREKVLQGVRVVVSEPMARAAMMDIDLERTCKQADEVRIPNTSSLHICCLQSTAFELTESNFTIFSDVLCIDFYLFCGPEFGDDLVWILRLFCWEEHIFASPSPVWARDLPAQIKPRQLLRTARPLPKKMRFF